MNYQEFKAMLIEKLSEHYGKDAKIEVFEKIKINGEKCEQVAIISEVNRDQAIPCHTLKVLYEEYVNGSMSMRECVNSIIHFNKPNECIRDCKAKILNWDYVKEQIYPVLINTKANKEMLENLVTVEWLDLSIIFMIRANLEEGGQWILRVSKHLCSIYNVSFKELMDQAFHNMKKGGYILNDICKILESCTEEETFTENCKKIDGEGMVVLSNRDKSWGAVAILDKESMQEICGDKNVYILPSSVHETILLLDTPDMSAERLDGIIQAVNEIHVRPEEVLSDHAYYYDAEVREIRMAA